MCNEMHANFHKRSVLCQIRFDCVSNDCRQRGSSCSDCRSEKGILRDGSMVDSSICISKRVSQKRNLTNSYTALSFIG